LSSRFDIRSYASSSRDSTNYLPVTVTIKLLPVLTDRNRDYPKNILFMFIGYMRHIQESGSAQADIASRFAHRVAFWSASVIFSLIDPSSTKQPSEMDRRCVLKLSLRFFDSSDRSRFYLCSNRLLFQISSDNGSETPRSRFLPKTFRRHALPGICLQSLHPAIVSPTWCKSTSISIHIYHGKVLTHYV
jgi:hypothetical protein